MATYTFNIVGTGSSELLGRGLNKETPDDMVQRYGTNTFTPDFDTVVGDITELADTGYTAYTMTGSTWTVSEVTDRSRASFTANDTQTMDSAATITCAYLTNTAGDILIGIAYFSTPISLSAGDSITFTSGQIDFIPSWS